MSEKAVAGKKGEGRVLEMDCKAFRENIHAFLDGELREPARLQMIGHAKTCPACGALLDDTTRLLTMLSELDGDVVMPIKGQAAWRSAIRDLAAVRSRPRISKWVRTVGSVAAVFAVLVAGTFALRMMANPVSHSSEAAYYGALPRSGGGDAQYASFDESADFSERPAPGDGAFIATDSATGGAGISAGGDDTGTPSGSANNERSQVLLKSATRSIETTAFDADELNLRDCVSEYGGYFESSDMEGSPIKPGEARGRTTRMTVRVPSGQFDDLLLSIDAIGTIVYRSESAEDISLRYYDAESRLSTYKEKHGRLKELIAQAESIEDIVTLEDKLYEVQGDIAALERQLRGWSSLRDDSVVTVTMVEIAVRDKIQPIQETLGGRMKSAFFDSVNWLMGFLEDMSVAAAIAVPMLVVLVPAFVLIIIIVRVVKRRRRKY